MLSETLSSILDGHPIGLAVLVCALTLASTLQDLKDATFRATDSFSPLENAFFWWGIGGLTVLGLAYNSRNDLLTLVGLLVVGVVYGLAAYAIYARNKERWKRQ